MLSPATTVIFGGKEVEEDAAEQETEQESRNHGGVSVSLTGQAFTVGRNFSTPQLPTPHRSLEASPVASGGGGWLLCLSAAPLRLSLT